MSNYGNKPQQMAQCLQQIDFDRETETETEEERGRGEEGKREEQGKRGRQRTGSGREEVGKRFKDLRDINQL